MFPCLVSWCCAIVEKDGTRCIIHQHNPNAPKPPGELVTLFKEAMGIEES